MSPLPTNPAPHVCTVIIQGLSLLLCWLQRGYNSDWLGGVFSKAVFLGNGLMAILSGLLAHTLVETLSLGPVAPFDAASVVMLLGGVIVLFTWPENYGDSSNKRSFLEQLGSGAKAITQGREKKVFVNG